MDLHGRTILITRAASQSGALRAGLESYGARVIECPAIEIAPVDDWSDVDRAILSVNTYDWLIFTSTNAVDHFMRRVREHGVSCSVPIAAVGHVTAGKLQEYGLRASKVPSDFRAEGLIGMFPQNLAGVRILIPRAEKARELLPDELRKRGATVDVVAVYRTQKAATSLGHLGTLLATEKIDAAAFLSPSAIRYFTEELAACAEATQRSFETIPVAAIGPVAREALEAAGLRVAIQPVRATAADLVEAIRAYFNNPKKNT
jgi:uroporphyrinogen III methyltransferase/synthase